MHMWCLKLSLAHYFCVHFLCLASCKGVTHVCSCLTVALCVAFEMHSAQQAMVMLLLSS